MFSKRSVRMLFVFLFAFTIVVVNAQDLELINTNPGFEEDFKGWEQYINAPAKYYNQIAFFGFWLGQAKRVEC